MPSGLRIAGCWVPMIFRRDNSLGEVFVFYNNNWVFLFTQKHRNRVTDHAGQQDHTRVELGFYIHRIQTHNICVQCCAAVETLHQLVTPLVLSRHSYLPKVGEKFVTISGSGSGSRAKVSIPINSTIRDKKSVAPTWESSIVLANNALYTRAARNAVSTAHDMVLDKAWLSATISCKSVDGRARIRVSQHAQCSKHFPERCTHKIIFTKHKLWYAIFTLSMNKSTITVQRAYPKTSHFMALQVVGTTW